MSTTEKMYATRDGHVGNASSSTTPSATTRSLSTMWEAGVRILSEFAADPEIRVVVITGAGGKAFVSGADISKFDSERAGEEAVARYNAMVENIYSSITPFQADYCDGARLLHRRRPWPRDLL